MNNTSSPYPTRGLRFGHCDFSDNGKKIDALLFLTISITATIGNVIVFICYFRHRVLRSTTNVFIISLTASDIIVAVLSIPYSFGVFLCNFRPPKDERKLEDVIYLICDMLPSILSIYSLCLVAVDRAIAVLKPFFHKRHINQRSAAVSVVAMWVFVASSVAFIFIMSRRMFTMYIIFMSYILPVFIMIVSYSLMGFVAKKHAADIAKLEKTMTRFRDQRQRENRELLNNNSLSPFEHRESDEKPLVVKFKNHGALSWIKMNLTPKSLHCLPDPRRRSSSSTGTMFLRRELKAALTLSLLLSCFVLSWTPFIALNIENYRCPTCPIHVNLVKYFKMLHYSNSALNPMLYILLNKSWKAAFKLTICCCVKRSTRVSEGTLSELVGW